MIKWSSMAERYHQYKREILAVILLVIMAGLYMASNMINVPLDLLPSADSYRQASPAIVPTPHEIVRGDTTKRQVIFTFDGGDGVQSADGILEALRKHGVQGTFFLTGEFVERNPALVWQIVVQGNEIFNHTYDHPHLPDVSAGHIIWELETMDMALQTALNLQYDESDFVSKRYSTRPYFRAPYGDRNMKVLDAAARAGYQSVYWTVDANDWEESSGMTGGEVEYKILSTLAPGNIYLMHIGDNITGAILDDVFTRIENQGYKIVSLTQGL